MDLVHVVRHRIGDDADRDWLPLVRSPVTYRTPRLAAPDRVRKDRDDAEVDEALGEIVDFSQAAGWPIAMAFSATGSVLGDLDFWICSSIAAVGLPRQRDGAVVEH